jgi:hypothetical protein
MFLCFKEMHTNKTQIGGPIRFFHLYVLSLKLVEFFFRID